MSEMYIPSSGVLFNSLLRLPSKNNLACSKKSSQPAVMDRTNSQEELIRKETELKKVIRCTNLTLLPLHSDFDRAIQEWQSNRKSQFWSRTAVRCLFAAIEAGLFTFRKMAEQMAEVSAIKFNAQEMEILTEKQVKGGIERTKYLSFPDSIKESFRLFGKAVGIKVKVDYGSSGYNDLLRTFQLRNRLMHPKGPFDVEVTAKDIETADRAIAWFNAAYLSVVEQCQAHLDQQVEELQKRSL